MTVFRVQDASGRGPFKPGFSDRWVDFDATVEKRPPFIFEFGVGVVKKALVGESIGCACESLDKIRAYFSETERMKLAALGYFVAKVDDARVLAQSETQIVFARTRPLNVGVELIPL